MTGDLGSILTVLALLGIVLLAMWKRCAWPDLFAVTLFGVLVALGRWVPEPLGPILTVLGLVALVLVAFMREWAPPDVIAMTAFCGLVILGLLEVKQALNVFSNPAPITIGAMFIMSVALEKTGVIDWLGGMLGKLVSVHLWVTLPMLMIVIALCSAFVNNTPIVAIFLPIVLAICRQKHLPASKLLIPMSYAAVLGGCCTLIGSSTNILVSGIAVDYGLEPLGMFEFAPVGLLIAGVGILYVWILGPWLLPDRLSISAILGPKDRRQFICHVLVKQQSHLVGKDLLETELADERNGFRIIEVRRTGARVVDSLSEIKVRGYDRVLLAVSSRNMVKDASGQDTLDPALSERLGIENLSVIEGAIIEGIVAPHSRLLGQSLKSARFRQTFGMLVLAVHRAGKNLAENFQNEELEFGDTILLLGPTSTFKQMRDEGDFMLMEDQPPARHSKWKALATLGAMGAVVALSALDIVPIAFAAIAACVVVMWLKCITPEQAYKAVDWSILFMLYGMLAVGSAMESSGAAKWLAHLIVNHTDGLVADAWRPLLVLSLFYLLGSMLTEVLSNNATALVLAPIAINAAMSPEMNLDPRPFVFAVAFSSSAAFSTPIGYQTHMMVYGPGGYRFSDFVKFGLPLNLVLWAVASWYLPLNWPF